MDEIIENLRVWTSYSNSGVLDFLGNSEILPIFIARNIANSGLIGGWQGTPVHYGKLAPSPILLRDWKGNKITSTEFERLYWKELKNINFREILKKFKILTSICSAKGIALIGYGENPEEDHRFYLARFINRTGLLKNSVQELELK